MNANLIVIEYENPTILVEDVAYFISQELEDGDVTLPDSITESDLLDSVCSSLLDTEYEVNDRINDMLQDIVYDAVILAISDAMDARED